MMSSQGVPISVRRAGRDPQLQLVVLAAVLTGFAFWAVQPPGYAQAIAESRWRLLGVLVVYPVVEEWLFRGLLQGALLERPSFRRCLWGVSGANITTSVAFVILHVLQHPLSWAVAVAAPSLVLGHFRERYGGILLPVGLHTLFNGIYVLAGLHW